tara:strand:- start:59 stop:478 length:420 start_codon:yes stop_codon:yes gene_type:complete
MGCFYKEIKLESKERGVHLVTREVLEKTKEIKEFKKGLMTMFIKHTSASLCINENADSSVREDLYYYLNKIVPENDPNYLHTLEGPDDMPAHIKSVLTGATVQIPIKEGRLSLGMWQGIYLCEHRNNPKERKIIITINY